MGFRAGILGADELEDYLELQNPKVKRAIEKQRDIRKGKTRPAEMLLAEFRKENAAKRKARRRRECDFALQAAHQFWMIACQLHSDQATRGVADQVERSNVQ